MKKGFIIAIDGPVAAGKGTIAVILAKRLNGFYLYTGGMYRSLTLACLRKNVDIKNNSEVAKMMYGIKIELDGEKVFLDNENVTERIKERDVVESVSIIASYADIREFMVKRQREIGEREINCGKKVVVEGRDVGTIIFPNADLKLFLTASVKVRAERRMKQIRLSGGDAPFEEILKGLENRDKIDSERDVNPLVSEPEKHGYFVLNNSDLTEEETLDRIIGELKERGLYDSN
jgi:CMP/dCMP kinase